MTTQYYGKINVGQDNKVIIKDKLNWKSGTCMSIQQDKQCHLWTQVKPVFHHVPYFTMLLRKGHSEQGYPHHQLHYSGYNNLFLRQKIRTSACNSLLRFFKPIRAEVLTAMASPGTFSSWYSYFRSLFIFFLYPVVVAKYVISALLVQFIWKSVKLMYDGESSRVLQSVLDDYG